MIVVATARRIFVKFFLLLQIMIVIVRTSACSVASYFSWGSCSVVSTEKVLRDRFEKIRNVTGYMGNKEEVKEVVEKLIDFTTRRQDETGLLHLVGPPGTGKTLLVTMASAAAFDCGKPEVLGPPKLDNIPQVKVIQVPMRSVDSMKEVDSEKFAEDIDMMKKHIIQYPQSIGIIDDVHHILQARDWAHNLFHSREMREKGKNALIFLTSNPDKRCNRTLSKVWSDNPTTSEKQNRMKIVPIVKDCWKIVHNYEDKSWYWRGMVIAPVLYPSRDEYREHFHRIVGDELKPLVVQSVKNSLYNNRTCTGYISTSCVWSGTFNYDPNPRATVVVHKDVFDVLVEAPRQYKDLIKLQLALRKCAIKNECRGESSLSPSQALFQQGEYADGDCSLLAKPCFNYTSNLKLNLEVDSNTRFFVSFSIDFKTKTRRRPYQAHESKNRREELRRL